MGAQPLTKKRLLQDGAAAAAISWQVKLSKLHDCPGRRSAAPSLQAPRGPMSGSGNLVIEWAGGDEVSPPAAMREIIWLNPLAT